MAMIMSYIFSWTVFNLLPILKYILGHGGIYYFFAFNSMMGGLFAVFYLPETMGKSFEEIARIMER